MAQRVGYRGEGAAHCKIQGPSAVSCAKNGSTDRDAVWDLDSGEPKKHALDVGPRRGAYWRNLANTTEPSMCGGDAASCQITTTCYDYISTA